MSFDGRYSKILGRSESYNRVNLSDLVYEDDELTPICCIRCGARMIVGTGDGSSCGVCNRAGSLTPTQLVVSQARYEKTSKQLLLYQTGSRELAEKLEQIDEDAARLLARRARKLEIEFATWQFVKPSQVRKSSLVRELILVSGDAFSLIGKK